MWMSNMNGKSLLISSFSPFALKFSKGDGEFFNSLLGSPQTKSCSWVDLEDEREHVT